MSNLRSYQHVTPTLRLFSGEGCLGSLPRELKRLGIERPAVFCGSTLGKRGSPLDLVREALGDNLACLFTGVTAHSSLPSVEAAARELRDSAADAVIAVGGGSAIVTARAASILVAEGREAGELATSFTPEGKPISPRLDAPKMPQIVVPTTPTTAIAKAGSAVFDPAKRARLAMFDPKTRAQSVFIQSAMIDSAPDRLVISASLNALCMAVEGLMSLSGDPLSDAQLMQALRLTVQRLVGSTPLGSAERGDLVAAAILCGQGTDHSGAGVVTVLGHAIGVPFHVDNGVANAIVLPHAMRFNAAASAAGLVKVGEAMGIFGTDADVRLEAIIARLTALFGALGVPPRLREAGVPQAELGNVALHGMADWFLRGNPRPVTEAAQLETLLKEAW